jgi:hypothetical protein
MVQAQTDSLQDSVESDLSKIPIGKDWDELAIDDGTVLLENNDYLVRIISRDGNIINSRISSVRFRDEVNAAQNPRFSVPPKDELRNNVQDYLSGTVQFFVDGQIAFAGDILKVETPQKEGSDITIKAQNPGRRLSDQTVDLTPDNFVLQDVIAKVVDRFNTYHAEHRDLLDSATLSGVNAVTNVITTSSGSSSGTITFTDVSSDASEMEYINVKAYTAPSVTITVSVDDPNQDDVVKEFTGLDYNQFGEWSRLELPTLPSVSYDIEFTIEDDSSLFDWIVITSNDVTRDVTPPDVTTVGQDSDLYSRSGSQLNNNFIASETSNAVYDSNIEGFRARQVGVFADVGGSGSDSDEVNGDSETLSPDTSTLPLDLSSKDEIKDSYVWARIRADQDATNDSDILWDYQIEVDGTADSALSPQRIDVGSYSWVLVDISNIGDATTPTVSLISSSSNSFNVDIDCLFWTNGPDSPHYNDPDFDNTVDSNLQLQYPREYHKNAWVTFNSVVAQNNITESTTTGQFNNTSFIAGDEWGPVQRITSDVSFPNPENTASVTDLYPYSAVDHQARVYLCASGERTNASPTRGYQSTELTSYDVDVSTNDLEIIFGQDLTGNRLSVISDLADASTQFYRWEGNNCKIFQRGTKKTNVDVRREDTTSSVGIEDVYSSAEVYGQGGVYSGVIEADDPPDFVNRRKQIRESDIETENDARRRAISFIRNNSSVEYEGSIDTNPTFAPVGSMLDGSLFDHGQDMVIESVRYSKSGTSISLGFEQRLSRKIRGLDNETTALTRSQTT